MISTALQHPKLDPDGWTLFEPRFADSQLQELRATGFTANSPGQRCLLDEPTVRRTALHLRESLVAADILPASAVAIQAIAFDKNPATNWKVTWHQNVMFPFARPVADATFTVPSVKEGIAYARPPRHVLEDLLAVRLHLDDCDETNGPLRVAPGSHRQGVYPSADITRAVEKYGETSCLAREGAALLMRPLLLHASSPATAPRHRRVLHVVYHTGGTMAEPWYRAVR